MANNKMNIEGKNYLDVPVWRRYTLTIEEAARYYPVSYTHLFPVSSTAKVMYCRMLDAMLSKGQEDENGILFVCFPVTAIAAVPVSYTHLTA